MRKDPNERSLLCLPCERILLHLLPGGILFSVLVHPLLVIFALALGLAATANWLIVHWHLSLVAHFTPFQ